MLDSVCKFQVRKQYQKLEGCTSGEVPGRGLCPAKKSEPVSSEFKILKVRNVFELRRKTETDEVEFETISKFVIT